MVYSGGNDTVAQEVSSVAGEQRERHGVGPLQPGRAWRAHAGDVLRRRSAAVESVQVQRGAREAGSRVCARARPQQRRRRTTHIVHGRHARRRTR